MKKHDTLFKPLANRSKAADGTVTYDLPEDGFVQLVPVGSAPNTLRGKRIMQLVDAKAIEEMFNRATSAGGEVLIDDEHFSHDPDKGTNAMAWQTFAADALQVRADGLYGRPSFTPVGLKNVTSGEKRFISPEFSPDAADLEEVSPGVFRPLRLTGFGLTNRPAFKSHSKPLANRDDDNDNANPQNNTMLKALVAGLFGITETQLDALDEAALKNRFTAVADSVKRTTTAETELATIKNREADGFITTHDAVIPRDEAVRKHVRETFLLNRDLASGLVAGFKAAKASEDPNKARTERKPLFNRDKASPPEGEDAADPKAAKRAAAIKNRAQELQGAAKSAGRTLNWDAAWSQAESENAE